jgi:hypothetical protein
MESRKNSNTTIFYQAHTHTTLQIEFITYVSIDIGYNKTASKCQNC